MKESKYLLLLGISAATGAAAGILSNRRKPELAGLFGAVAGVAFAALVTFACKGLKEQMDNEIDYYSETSPLYQGFDDVEVE
jgi:hypothetical protein